MKKLLILLCLGSLMFTFTGCQDLQDTVEIKGKIEVQSKSSSRFATTGQTFYINGNSYSLTVVKDIETNVLYLWDNNYNRGGLTPWLDSNGQPMKDISK
jgi:hypothetical protein